MHVLKTTAGVTAPVSAWSWRVVPSVVIARKGGATTAPKVAKNPARQVVA